MVQKISFKIFLDKSSGSPFSAGQNHLCNFCRGHHEEHFCEIILNLDQEKMFKDISYLEPFCSAEWNNLCNFGGGYHKEQFCEIILNFEQWFRRCHL